MVIKFDLDVHEEYAEKIKSVDTVSHVHLYGSTWGNATMIGEDGDYVDKHTFFDLREKYNEALEHIKHINSINEFAEKFMNEVIEPVPEYDAVINENFFEIIGDEAV